MYLNELKIAGGVIDSPVCHVSVGLKQKKLLVPRLHKYPCLNKVPVGKYCSVQDVSFGGSFLTSLCFPEGPS